ncbi:MAG: hypothetical protein ACJAZH_001658 [Roseivirga sp.]|jgi:hypothetical protein
MLRKRHLLLGIAPIFRVIFPALQPVQILRLKSTQFDMFSLQP